MILDIFKLIGRDKKKFNKFMILIKMLMMRKWFNNFKIIEYNIFIKMSYGWLTESALMPKPAIAINVDNSSVDWVTSKFF